MKPIRMDQKGRLVIPRSVREALHLHAGDLFAFEPGEDAVSFRVTRISNPFDVMAEYAIREFEAGRTTDLRDFARRNGYVIDDRGKASRRSADDEQQDAAEPSARERTVT